MSFLLDTNVISEWVKPRPDPNVMAWAERMDEDRIFLSVISFAEIRRGIELMENGRRRNRLTVWLAEELPQQFADRILDVDHRVAEQWGLITAERQMAGAPLAIMDGFFAATATVHGLTLVTRNVQHFAHLGVPIFNPWQP